MTLMAPQDLPPKGGWKVTGQVPQTRAVQGQPYPVAGYVVNFTTGYGVTGSVFIPGLDYTADNVKAAIAAAVIQLDAISSLTHTS